MSKKGENIYKRKDNRWEARYMFGHNADGSPRYRYCYGRSYREVKEKLSREKAVVVASRGKISIGKKQFSHYCDEWLQLCRDRVKESTYSKYYSTLELHIKPRLGTCSVSMLTTVEIEKFSHALLYEENLSPKTVRDILLLLHSILKYTAKQQTFPMPFIEIPYPKDLRKEIRVLTREEQSRLIEYLLSDSDVCKFGVLLALLTGLRIGEICALKWGNVSLNDKTLRVNSTLQRLKVFEETEAEFHRTKVVISNPKSDNSSRIIPLTDFAFYLCEKYYGKNPETFILTGTRRYMEPRTLQYRFQQYIADCGLKDVHFHTLRHTFATRCVEVEFEIKSLSEILGHSNPRITLDRYVHSSMELKRDNMNKLASLGY